MLNCAILYKSFRVAACRLAHSPKGGQHEVHHNRKYVSGRQRGDLDPGLSSEPSRAWRRDRQSGDADTNSYAGIRRLYASDELGVREDVRQARGARGKALRKSGQRGRRCYQGVETHHRGGRLRRLLQHHHIRGQQGRRLGHPLRLYSLAAPLLAQSRTSLDGARKHQGVFGYSGTGAIDAFSFYIRQKLDFYIIICYTAQV